MSRRKRRSLYRYSPWIETTFDRDGKVILLPIRARAVFRGRKARGESQLLVAGVWRDHMLFPWCNLRHVPNEGQRETYGAAIADAIIEHFEENDPVGLEEVLAESPVVELPEEMML